MTKRTAGVDPEALENREQAAAPTTTKRTRRDKGTRRIVLPAWLVKELEKRADKEGLSVTGLLEELVGATSAITLPPAVLARLAPAAAGSGRTISELLGEMVGDLVELLDGRMSQSVDGGTTYLLVPSLEDRLVEAFRARIRAAKEPAS